MRKIQKFAVMFILMLSLLTLVACENRNDGGKNPGVSYSTVKINYHYEYDTIIENYYQETYSVVSGVSNEIEIKYTPPTRLGYKFLGWTLSSGGKGDLISSKFNVVGVGAGTTYNFYAKYEIIPYEVVYHLDGGENSPDNPTQLTGTKNLQAPKRDGYKFDGWYLESDFIHYITALQMQDNDEPTLHVYAKWLKIFTITYKSSIDNLPIEGDKEQTQYIEDYFYETYIRLKNEHFEHYLFLGWTYDGQSEPAKFDSKIEIPPRYNKDLVFVANYLKATASDDFPGLKVTIDENSASYTVPEDFVGEIIVPDIAGRGKYVEYLISSVHINYYGEVPPTVIARDGVSIYYNKR